MKKRPPQGPFRILLNLLKWFLRIILVILKIVDLMSKTPSGLGHFMGK